MCATNCSSALTVGTATVIKETAKKWFIERTQAGDFAKAILKEKPHMYDTPERAWDAYIQHHLQRLERARQAVHEAEQDAQRAHDAYRLWQSASQTERTA